MAASVLVLVLARSPAIGGEDVVVGPGGGGGEFAVGCFYGFAEGVFVEGG